MDIQGKTALVTGAGAGIGRAIARALARKGAAHVVVADINEAAARETARLAAADGTQASVRQIDVTDLAALKTLFADCDAELGLDIVVNNAGIVSGPPSFPDTPVDRMAQVVAINLIGMMAGTRLSIEYMRGRKAPGAIINMCSVAAFGAMPTDPAYSASKAGLLNFTQACAPLKEAFGIRVNAVCPGMTDTDIVNATGGGRPADWLAPVLDHIELLRPEVIADATIALIEDEAKAGDHVVLQNAPRAPA
jgi:NAD(P)-dependent dehydrogenase (short-subunit alcohol dehydrogenase family)